MSRGQLFTPAQLRVGRRPVLVIDDRERVAQVLASSPSLTEAARILKVARRILHTFVAAAGLRVRGPGRPRIVLAVDIVRDTLARAPSLIAAARALRVGRLLLRRFAVTHGLTWADGRRRH